MAVSSQIQAARRTDKGFIMKKRVRYLLLTAFVIVLIVFIATSIRRASKRAEGPSPPILNEAPMVIYGTLEPRGKAVSISPKANGIIRDIYVEEGDSVQRGQSLCTLENTTQNGSLYRETIISPQIGVIYKRDLRVGEAFSIGDRDRLILGSSELQVCCDVEVLWIGKIEKQKTYDVFNAENEEPVGAATYHSASRYLRPKSIRTEEPGEKTSTQYQEVIMGFEPSKPDLPIGLPVMLRTGDKR